MSTYQNNHHDSTSNTTASSSIEQAHSGPKSSSYQQAANSTSLYLSDNATSNSKHLRLSNEMDNHCVKAILTIVARGSAIITELHRLVELVPAPFKYNTTIPQNATSSIHNNNYSDNDKRFTMDDLIFDFRYFKYSDKCEARIESNEVLKKADEDFCENYINILTRFYLTFESIQRFSVDLNNFIQELEAGAYVGQSLDDLLQDNDSRQLLCEAHFLLGHMLLTVDNNFEGGLRERLMVSYYRYSAFKSSPNSSIDDTCNLLRSTGFRSLQQQIHNSAETINHHRPQNYPESFFERVGVNQSIVSLLIAKLLSIDIYNQTVSTFPHPDHRSRALSQQASMLYVILYFCPNILISQKSRMREITDKFFYDNWIINVHMGELVNLIEAWEPYKAARESLSQLHDIEGVTNISTQFSLLFERVSKQSKEYLTDGWLNENSVLENHARILNHIRDANVVLKWMLLHSKLYSNWQTKLSKSLNSIVLKSLPEHERLYGFLQELAELEKNFTKIYSEMIDKRDCAIRNNKIKAKETLNELIDIFTDQKPMRWIQPGVNSKLTNLLKQLSSNLDEVKFDHQNARDNTINLINEIDVAQDSYSDGKNLQVVQLFSDTKASLVHILRSLSLSDDIKIILHSVSDFSYCWRIMDETFTSHMQKIIKADPLKVHGLESTFLKLGSAFEINLIRIQQVKSQADLISVSQYYSTKLVSYIRDVLHAIPETILELLTSIISIQTEYVLRDMPSKISLENLKDYTLPNKRYKMLELTFKVSHFAECMSLMQDTTIGLIRINSKQLLEDGIRRELVRRMSDSIQRILQFDDYTTSNQTPTSCQEYSQNLMIRLNKLNITMSGYKNSFEYIQDYLFIYGLRMWQEELGRVVKFNVEQATEVLLNRNYSQQGYGQSSMDYQSLYQSDKAPIPVYSPDPLKSSFIVRLLNEVLRITDPRLTIYDEQMSAWYEQKGQHEKVVDLKIFELILSSLSVTGLNGFDQLCCAVLTLELQKLDTLLISLCVETKSPLNNSAAQQSNLLLEALKSIKNLRNQANVNKQIGSKTFAAALAKVTPHSDKIINHLLSIGQLQAIRISASCVLSTKCRYEARNLYGCLETLNTTLLATLRHGKRLSQHKKASLPRQNSSQVLSNSEDLGETTLDENDDADIDCNIEDSQLVFELTNHLEWIGLSDPMSKIYTLALQTSPNSQVYEFRENLIAIDMVFLVLLEQCSKLHFSRSINGFIPKQSRSFYEKAYTVDAQPLFYGLMTFINHCQPSLPIEKGNSANSNNDTAEFKQSPLNRLLAHMSSYVKLMLDQQPSQTTSTISMKPQDLTLEAGNMILSMIELIRLSKESRNNFLKETFLPKFLLDTFQYTVCHLNDNNYDIN